VEPAASVVPVQPAAGANNREWHVHLAGLGAIFGRQSLRAHPQPGQARPEAANGLSSYADVAIPAFMNPHEARTGAVGPIHQSQHQAFERSALLDRRQAFRCGQRPHRGFRPRRRRRVVVARGRQGEGRGYAANEVGSHGGPARMSRVFMEWSSGGPAFSRATIPSQFSASARGSKPTPILRLSRNPSCHQSSLQDAKSARGAWIYAASVPAHLP
jgi:hypothetical protein